MVEVMMALGARAGAWWRTVADSVHAVAGEASRARATRASSVEAASVTRAVLRIFAERGTGNHPQQIIGGIIPQDQGNGESADGTRFPGLL